MGRTDFTALDDRAYGARPAAFTRNSQRTRHPRLGHLRLVFYPPSSPFGWFAAAFGADQLSVPVWAAGAILGAIGIHLPLNLRRGKSQSAFFVTRRRFSTAAF